MWGFVQCKFFCLFVCFVLILLLAPSGAFSFLTKKITLELTQTPKFDLLVEWEARQRLHPEEKRRSKNVAFPQGDELNISIHVGRHSVTNCTSYSCVWYLFNKLSAVCTSAIPKTMGLAVLFAYQIHSRYTGCMHIFNELNEYHGGLVELNSN